MAVITKKSTPNYVPPDGSVHHHLWGRIKRVKIRPESDQVFTSNNSQGIREMSRDITRVQPEK